MAYETVFYKYRQRSQLCYYIGMKSAADPFENVLNVNQTIIIQTI